MLHSGLLLPSSVGRVGNVLVGTPTSSAIPLVIGYSPGATGYEYCVSSTSPISGFGPWTVLSALTISGLSASTQYWFQLRGTRGPLRGPTSLVYTGTTASSGVSFPTFSGATTLGRYEADVGISLSGADVTNWADTDGRPGVDLVGAASHRPTFGATSFNSAYPGLTIDGTSQYLVTANRAIASLGAASMSFWMVLCPTSAPQTYGRYLSVISTGNSEIDYQGQGHAVALAKNNTNTALAGFASVGVTPLASFNISYGTNYDLIVVFDGTNTKIYNGNVEVGTSANSSPTRWGKIGTDLLTLGLGATLATDGSGNLITPSADFGKGIIPAFGLAAGTFTSGDRAALRTYNQAKWGV